MANTPLSGLTQDSSPPASGRLPFLDPTDPTMAPAGTDKTVTIANLFAAQGAVTLGGDLGGTAAAPQVTKLQGTPVSPPPGGTTHYLNASGAWTVPAGGSGGGSVLDWVSVAGYGADPSGKSDSTTAFTNAIGAIPKAGGVIYVPAGTYLISGTLTFGPNQGMIGDGHSASVLNYTGSGVCVKAADNAAFTGNAEGGWFQGWQVSGYNGGAGAIGAQIVDLQGVKMDDVSFYGCATAGLYFTTAGSGWSEEGWFTKVACIQCGTAGDNATGAVVMNSTSFDYGVYEFTIVTPPGAHALVLQNGVNLNGPRVGLRGNLYCDSPNTAAMIAIDPGNANGTSYMTNVDLDASMETAGSGTGHYLVLMGSSNSASQFSGSGVLSIYPAFGNSQGISNPNFLPFGFSGVVNTVDSYGNNFMAAGDARVIIGGKAEQWAGNVGSALGGVVYTQFASKWVFQLASGSGSANAVTVSGLRANGKTIDLIIQQPSSGAAGTIPSWPSNVKWAGGAAPVLSTSNNAADWIRLEYLPPTQVGASAGYLLGYLVAKGFSL